MTRVVLLEELKRFCEDTTKNMILPTQVEKGDTKLIERAPEIYRMRLPDSKAAKKLAPYIIIQIPASKHFRDEQESNRAKYRVVVRFIFSVYCDNEEEGAIMLLNLMDRVQEQLLKKIQIGKAFVLDENEQLESIVYPEDTAPFYAGEMVGTFKLIPIEREVDLFVKDGKYG